MTIKPSEDTTAPEPESIRRTRPLRWFRPILGTLLLLVAFLVQSVAAAHPSWVEEHYSEAAFPRIASALTDLSRHSPVSLAELLIALVVLRIAVGVVRTLHRLTRPRAERPSGLLILANALLGLLGLAGLLYAGYLASWGLNHHRQPFAEVAGWQVEPPRTGELVELACELTEQLNELRAELDEDDAGVFRLGLRRAELDRRAREAFGELTALHPSLRVAPGVPRRPLASPLMTASWISGIYSPFTGEVHINAELPDAQQGFVVCHELAHSLGFAREDEANFLGYLACESSGDNTLRYSGALALWSYLSRALGVANPVRLIGINERLSAPVQRDLAEIREFWTRGHSAFTELATELNNTYLKSQGQVHGVASYGLAVDLIVESWRRGRPDFGSEAFRSALDEVRERLVRIAFIGGCFTSGADDEAYAYPERVAESLLERGIETRIYNLGSCRQTLTQSLREVYQASELKADIVVLELGAEDLEGGTRLEVAEEQVESILFTARRAGMRVLFLTSERVDLVSSVERAVAFDELIKRQSEMRGAPFVDGFAHGLAGRRDALRYDLEHPNYASVQTLAERVVPELAGVVARLRRGWALERMNATEEDEP